jgi:hypothetical protein
MGGTRGPVHHRMHDGWPKLLESFDVQVCRRWLLVLRD